MKNTQIALAALAAISSVHYASAQTTIVLTGSSAFRAAAVNGVLEVFNTAGNSLSGYGYNGTSFTGATYHIFKGNIAGMSNPVTVKTNWTGSARGVNAVSNAATVNINTLLDATATSPTGTSGASTASLTTANKADIGFADNLQTSTVYQTNPYGATNETKVGIVPFAWVIGQNGDANITSISTQTAKTLLSGGFTTASQFTGNASHTQRIFLGGRDDDSGTRITTLAETGYGVQTPVTQYRPITFGSGGTANKLATINLTLSSGNSGESSGGTLLNYARYETSNVTDASGLSGLSNGSMSFVIYVGETDSYGAVFGVGGGNVGNSAGNGRYLSFNGVNPFTGIAKRPASTETTINSPTINVPVGTVTGLIAGQIVSGTGIAGGSIIVSTKPAATAPVTTLDQITLDKNSTVTQTVAGTNDAKNVQIGALVPAAIKNGAYPFWNYEYIGNLTLTANKQIFRDALVNSVTNVTFGFSGLADDNSFRYTRGEDGGILVSK